MKTLDSFYMVCLQRLRLNTLCTTSYTGTKRGDSHMILDIYNGYVDSVCYWLQHGLSMHAEAQDARPRAAYAAGTR